MSNAHKGSRLILKDQLVATDFNSAHFDFNIDGTGIYQGRLIEPTSDSVCIIKPQSGKFGGAISLGEGTVNLYLGTEGNEGIGSDTGNMDKINYYTGDKLFGNYSWKLRNTVGSSFNMYVTDPYSPTPSNVFTLSAYAKRLDGKPITTVGTAYIYSDADISYDNTVKITPAENGWYRLEATKNFGSSTVVNLTGFTDLDGSTSWLFDGWQVEGRSSATPYAPGNTPSGKLSYPIVPYANEGTIHFWSKISQFPAPSNCTLIDSYGSSAGTSDANRMYLLQNGTSLNWYMGNSSGSEVKSITASNYSSNFALIAITWKSGGNRNLYFGRPDGTGVDKISSTNIYFPNNWNDKILIGGRPGSETTNSLMSDLVISNKELSEEDILAIYFSREPLYNPYDYRSFAY